MSLLSPGLLQQLARSRILAPASKATMGVGERRSRASGAGIEFSDHRAYQPGDDFRHVDRHVHARLGQHMVRQFTLYQQLHVTILLDHSASMGYGARPKLARAIELAGALAFLGRQAGDRVRVGAFAAGRLAWSPPLAGAQGASQLFGWLQGLAPRGAGSYRELAAASLPGLTSPGLLAVIGDWFGDEVPDALAAWRSAGQEILAVHVLAREELEPERLGSGSLRVVDAETGHTHDASLDPEACRLYRSELDAWLLRLRDDVHRHQGRYVQAWSDLDLEPMLLGEWRRQGLIS